MQIIKFNRELRANSDDALNELSLIARSLVGREFSLFISNSPSRLWVLTFPDELTYLPQTISILGQSELTIPVFKPTYWVYRPPLRFDKLIRMGGKEVKSIYDIPWEELFRNNYPFKLVVKTSQNQRVPYSDLGALIALEITTDNRYIAEQIRGWLGGICSEKPFSTFAYDHELVFFLRPPISAPNFYPEGILKPALDFPEIIEYQPEILTKHCLVCGQTRFGKSNTVKLALDKVVQSNSLKGLLLIDLKGEYQDWAIKNHVEYLPVGYNPDSLTNLNINPFIPPQDQRLSNHIKHLATLFTVSGFGGAGYALPSYMKLIIEEFYRAIWSKPDHELTDRELEIILRLTGKELLQKKFAFCRPPHSMLDHFYGFWQKRGNTIFARIIGDDGRNIGRNMSDIKGAISARIRDLKTSVLNSFSYQKDAVSPDHLLERKIVLSLQGASQDEIILLTSLFTLFSVTTAQLRGNYPKLRNLLVIEEAHRVMERTSSSSAEISTAKQELANILQDAIAELGSRGVGLLIIDQSPRRLIEGVIANTGTKIIHRLSDSIDQNEIIAATGVSNNIDLTSLERGECLIKLESTSINRRIMPLWSSRV